MQADDALAPSVPLLMAAGGGNNSTSIPEVRCCTELHNLISWIGAEGAQRRRFLLSTVPTHLSAPSVASLQVQGPIQRRDEDGALVAEPAIGVPVCDGDDAADEPPVLSRPAPDRSRDSGEDDLEVLRPSD